MAHNVSVRIIPSRNTERGKLPINMNDPHKNAWNYEE